MPWWKYVNNRWLTAVMNMLTGAKLSEYHTGYRAFSAELLKKLPLERNTDDFAFDAQMLMEILATGATIGEVSCPTKKIDVDVGSAWERCTEIGRSRETSRFCVWQYLRYIATICWLTMSRSQTSEDCLGAETPVRS